MIDCSVQIIGKQMIILELGSDCIRDLKYTQMKNILLEIKNLLGTYVNRKFLFTLFVMSCVVANVAQAQNIPMNLDITITPDKTHVKVGDVVTYTVWIRASKTAGTDAAVNSSVAFSAIPFYANVFNKQAYADFTVNVEGLNIGPILSSTLPEGTIQSSGANTLQITRLPVCSAYMLRRDDIFTMTTDGPNVYMPTYGFQFSGVASIAQTSVIGHSFSIPSSLTWSDLQYNNNTTTGFAVANTSSYYAQTLIIPTIAPTSDVTLCNSGLLAKTFTAVDLTKPNPISTTYTWATSNPQGQSIIGALNSQAVGSTAAINYPLTLSSSTSALSGELIYTVTPTITTSLINTAGLVTSSTTTIGDPMSFKVTLHPVAMLASIRSTQLEGGQLQLGTVSTIASTSRFISTFNWYGPNNQTTLIASNTTGVLNLSDWQKATVDNTYYVKITNTYYDEDGVLQASSCESNILSIVVKPLHLTLTPVPTELKEGSSGKFVLSLLDSDGNPQGFNKDEVLTITLRSDNEARPGHYRFQSMQVSLGKMSTIVDIPIDALADNILYNTEVLKIQVACDDLGSANGDMTLLDSTADNPNNTLITLESGMIEDSGQITLHATLPQGITAGHDIVIQLSSDPVKSDLTMLSKMPQFSSAVTIKAYDNVGSFYVQSGSNGSTLPATLVLNGTAIGYQVKDGTVIILNRAISIPNLFSPNNDIQNNTWVIKSIEKYPQFTLEVFDEWGQEIHKTSSASYKEWDGRDDKNGREMPVATYYYQINLVVGGKAKNYAGYVALVR